MNCPQQTPETAGLLLDYCARRLDPRISADLELHIEKCNSCAAYCTEQRAVWDALDEWKPMPVSMDFNRRLWQRIDAAATAPWYRAITDALRFANWTPAFPVAAAVLIIAGGFLLDHPGQRDARTQLPGISVSEAEQLERTLEDIQLLNQLDTVALPQAAAPRSM